jgi:steroid delta-isomerase-like uncharacterized protein
MTTTENKRLAKRWFEEVWNQHRSGAISKMLAPDGTAHGLGPGGQVLRGPEAFAEFQRSFVNAFPDLKVALEEVIAEGNLVAIRWRATGTHRGDGIGVKATSRPMAMSGMSFVRVRKGRITDGWNTIDMLGMHQQLGTLSQLQ